MSSEKDGQLRIIPRFVLLYSKKYSSSNFLYISQWFCHHLLNPLVFGSRRFASIRQCDDFLAEDSKKIDNGNKQYYLGSETKLSHVFQYYKVVFCVDISQSSFSVSENGLPRDLLLNAVLEHIYMIITNLNNQHTLNCVYFTIVAFRPELEEAFLIWSGELRSGSNFDILREIIVGRFDSVEILAMRKAISISSRQFCKPNGFVGKAPKFPNVELFLLSIIEHMNILPKNAYPMATLFTTGNLSVQIPSALELICRAGIHLDIVVEGTSGRRSAGFHADLSGLSILAQSSPGRGRLIHIQSPSVDLLEFESPNDICVDLKYFHVNYYDPLVPNSVISSKSNDLDNYSLDGCTLEHIISLRFREGFILSRIYSNESQHRNVHRVILSLVFEKFISKISIICYSIEVSFFLEHQAKYSYSRADPSFYHPTLLSITIGKRLLSGGNDFTAVNTVFEKALASIRENDRGFKDILSLPGMPGSSVCKLDNKIQITTLELSSKIDIIDSVCSCDSITESHFYLKNSPRYSVEISKGFGLSVQLAPQRIDESFYLSIESLIISNFTPIDIEKLAIGSWLILTNLSTLNKDDASSNVFLLSIVENIGGILSVNLKKITHGIGSYNAQISSFFNSLVVLCQQSSFDPEQISENMPKFLLLSNNKNLDIALPYYQSTYCTYPLPKSSKQWERLKCELILSKTIEFSLQLIDQAEIIDEEKVELLFCGLLSSRLTPFGSKSFIQCKLSILKESFEIEYFWPQECNDSQYQAKDSQFNKAAKELEDWSCNFVDLAAKRDSDIVSFYLLMDAIVFGRDSVDYDDIIGLAPLISLQRAIDICYFSTVSDAFALNRNLTENILKSFAIIPFSRYFQCTDETMCRNCVVFLLESIDVFVLLEIPFYLSNSIFEKLTVSLIPLPRAMKASIVPVLNKRGISKSQSYEERMIATAMKLEVNLEYIFNQISHTVLLCHQCVYSQVLCSYLLDSSGDMLFPSDIQNGYKLCKEVGSFESNISSVCIAIKEYCMSSLDTNVLRNYLVSNFNDTVGKFLIPLKDCNLFLLRTRNASLDESKLSSCGGVAFVKLSAKISQYDYSFPPSSVDIVDILLSVCAAYDKNGFFDAIHADISFCTEVNMRDLVLKLDPILRSDSHQRLSGLSLSSLSSNDLSSTPVVKPLFPVQFEYLKQYMKLFFRNAHLASLYLTPSFIFDSHWLTVVQDLLFESPNITEFISEFDLVYPVSFGSKKNINQSQYHDQLVDKILTDEFSRMYDSTKVDKIHACRNSAASSTFEEPEGYPFSWMFISVSHTAFQSQGKPIVDGISFTELKITVRMHSFRDFAGKRDDAMERIKSDIVTCVFRLNQKILLDDMYETHYASTLLIPLAPVIPKDSTLLSSISSSKSEVPVSPITKTDNSGKQSKFVQRPIRPPIHSLTVFPKSSKASSGTRNIDDPSDSQREKVPDSKLSTPAITTFPSGGKQLPKSFTSGSFECKRQFEMICSLYAGAALSLDLVLRHLESAVLNHFALNDRENYFVSKDSNGCVFYMKFELNEQDNKHVHLGMYAISEISSTTVNELRQLLEHKILELSAKNVSSVLSRSSGIQPSFLSFLRHCSHNRQVYVRYRLPSYVRDIYLFCTLLRQVLLSTQILNRIIIPSHDKKPVKFEEKFNPASMGYSIPASSHYQCFCSENQKNSEGGKLTRQSHVVEDKLDSQTCHPAFFGIKDDVLKQKLKNDKEDACVVWYQSDFGLLYNNMNLSSTSAASSKPLFKQIGQGLALLEFFPVAETGSEIHQPFSSFITGSKGALHLDVEDIKSAVLYKTLHRFQPCRTKNLDGENDSVNMNGDCESILSNIEIVLRIYPTVTMQSQVLIEVFEHCFHQAYYQYCIERVIRTKEFQSAMINPCPKEADMSSKFNDLESRSFRTFDKSSNSMLSLIHSICRVTKVSPHFPQSYGVHTVPFTLPKRLAVALRNEVLDSWIESFKSSDMGASFDVVLANFSQSSKNWINIDNLIVDRKSTGRNSSKKKTFSTCFSSSWAVECLSEFSNLIMGHNLYEEEAIISKSVSSKNVQDVSVLLSNPSDFRIVVDLRGFLLSSQQLDVSQRLRRSFLDFSVSLEGVEIFFANVQSKFVKDLVDIATRVVATYIDDYKLHLDRQSIYMGFPVKMRPSGDASLLTNASSSSIATLEAILSRFSWEYVKLQQFSSRGLSTPHGYMPLSELYTFLKSKEILTNVLRQGYLLRKFWMPFSPIRNLKRLKTLHLDILRDVVARYESLILEGCGYSESMVFVLPVPFSSSILCVEVQWKAEIDSSFVFYQYRLIDVLDFLVNCMPNATKEELSFWKKSLKLCSLRNDKSSAESNYFSIQRLCEEKAVISDFTNCVVASSIISVHVAISVDESPSMVMVDPSIVISNVEDCLTLGCENVIFFEKIISAASILTREMNYSHELSSRIFMSYHDRSLYDVLRMENASVMLFSHVVLYKKIQGEDIPVIIGGMVVNLCWENLCLMDTQVDAKCYFVELSKYPSHCLKPLLRNSKYGSVILLENDMDENQFVVCSDQLFEVDNTLQEACCLLSRNIISSIQHLEMQLQIERLFKAPLILQDLSIDYVQWLIRNLTSLSLERFHLFQMTLFSLLSDPLVEKEFYEKLKAACAGHVLVFDESSEYLDSKALSPNCIDKLMVTNSQQEWRTAKNILLFFPVQGFFVHWYFNASGYYSSNLLYRKSCAPVVADEYSALFIPLEEAITSCAVARMNAWAHKDKE